jgi:hypothetical protein
MKNHKTYLLCKGGSKKMNVIPISSKMMFRDFNPRADERVSEGVKFFGGVMLTFWGPIIMACLVLGQAMPFYWMLAIDALGVLWGVCLYNKPSGNLPSCVPVHSAPDVPSVVRVSGVRDAA